MSIVGMVTSVYPYLTAATRIHFLACHIEHHQVENSCPHWGFGVYNCQWPVP